ncbi:thermonuclease family protein [Pareuzebyella sediminis]|uniref:thermonuclease family protein n=1 Tax=Pareuzebyella sediminis TaxID=2607998 RepID=UPI0011EDD348|nr:thermonuclease family protein [Pareuzebyella sediminis]
MTNKNKWLFLSSLLLVFACGERSYKGERQKLNNQIDQKQDLEKIPQSTSSEHKEILGKVIKIADGDTFTLIFENNFEVRVRLDGIDCPEKKQAFSNNAKLTLSDLIFGKMVRVKYEDKDRYGRVLGEVFEGDVNVNQEMVRRGYAWHFKRYSDDPILSELELEAKENKVGLWTDPNPMPPWDYRKR